jgi:hypothetical protein
MQSNDMANKKIVYVDGVEQPDLVSVPELSFESSTVEVPSFEKITEVASNITKNPRLPFVFKNQRNTATRKLLKDWKFKKEHHDVIIVETDGDGVEYDRVMYTDCQCVIWKEVGYDASSPSYAQTSIELTYYDRIPL